MMLIGGTEKCKIILHRGRLIKMISVFHNLIRNHLKKKVFDPTTLIYRYFPANFVTTGALEARGDTPTEPPEVIGAPPEKSSSAAESKALTCVALFDYVSDEPGDLSFQAGETIIIVKKVFQIFNISQK